MARITRPGSPTGKSGSAQISESAASRAGVGQASIGQQVTRAGEDFKSTRVGQLAAEVGAAVSKVGQDYFEQSKRAHQSAVYTNAMNKATTEFAQLEQERLQRITDENGNPTYDTLSDDIAQIGRDVAGRVGGSIMDAEASAKFQNQFSSYIANRQLNGLKTARKQQIDFGRASLSKGLETISQQALNDDISNIGIYEGNARQILDDNLEAGIISASDHQRQVSAFEKGIRQQSISNLIETDPSRAASILQGDASSLGIPEEEKTNLSNVLQAKVRSDQIESIKVAKAQKIMAQNDQAQRVESIETAIDAGVMREDELLRQKPSLPDNVFKDLSKRFVNKAVKRAKEVQRIDAISQDIAENRVPITANTADLNTIYNSEVDRRLALDPNQQNIKMTDKARVVASIKREVPQFTKELNSVLLYGDSSGIEEAVAGYNYLKEKGINLQKLSKDSEAIAESISFYRGRLDLPIEEAVNRSREAIMGVDDEAKKLRDKDFNKLDSFKVSNIKETTKDALDLDGFLFGIGDTKVTLSSTDTFRRLAKEAYRTTGDEELATQIASSQMNKTYGVSQVTNEDTFMFAPPEKMYPDITPDELRADLEQTFPEISEGLGISSDSLTNTLIVEGTKDGQPTKIQVATYAVTQLKDGIRVPVVDENGEVVRWMPDRGKVSGKRLEESESRKAEAVRIAKIEELSRSGLEGQDLIKAIQDLDKE